MNLVRVWHPRIFIVSECLLSSSSTITFNKLPAKYALFQSKIHNVLKIYNRNLQNETIKFGSSSTENIGYFADINKYIKPKIVCD